jgi:hypothetical protein
MNPVEKLIGEGNMEMDTITKNGKYTVQSRLEWTEDGDNEFFDTVEEAAEFFQLRWPYYSNAVIVMKVADVVDITASNRIIEVK